VVCQERVQRVSARGSLGQVMLMAGLFLGKVIIRVESVLETWARRSCFTPSPEEPGPRFCSRCLSRAHLSVPEPDEGRFARVVEVLDLPELPVVARVVDERER